ncbi:DUF6580 family putative transport protein [Deminuibacter soli]|uniref:ECF transporter S component n=1 Tax=Deminuibacter soli TaxID=2291815 RepID=A0A3E1NFF6_9BACT|nr:DUF6580 family putative transport protein [Deminuibacter soli]RFM26607.1 hypothetical protein DXN05_18715 [Deminuibacter soli]
MSKIIKLNPRSAVVLLITVIVAGLRLAGCFSKEISPLINFTPVGAMALFGGACFTGNVKPFAFPLLTLFISDFILSYTIYAPYRGDSLLYTGWYWTYLAFALMTLTGKLMVTKLNGARIIGGILVCTLIHWIVSDISAWQMGTLYPKTFGGYIQCLIAAIPYEMRFLAGTAIYGAVMFGTMALLQQRYPKLKMA